MPPAGVTSAIVVPPLKTVLMLVLAASTVPVPVNELKIEPAPAVPEQAWLHDAMRIVSIPCGAAIESVAVVALAGKATHAVATGDPDVPLPCQISASTESAVSGIVWMLRFVDDVVAERAIVIDIVDVGPDTVAPGSGIVRCRCYVTSRSASRARCRHPERDAQTRPSKCFHCTVPPSETGPVMGKAIEPAVNDPKKMMLQPV